MKIIKLVTWPARKLLNYAESLNTLLQAPTGIKEGVSSEMTWTSKFVSATTGAAKGTVDAAEALVCQDGVCFVIYCVGVASDSLQILASDVPGPNVTALVTMPILIGSKVFVWACKKSKLPWGGC